MRSRRGDVQPVPEQRLLSASDRGGGLAFRVEAEKMGSRAQLDLPPSIGPRTRVAAAMKTPEITNAVALLTPTRPIISPNINAIRQTMSMAALACRGLSREG